MWDDEERLRNEQRLRAVVSRHAERDDEHCYEMRDPSRFNRIDFAMKALDILRPRHLTVVVYERIQGLQVERGIDHGRGRGAGWAMVGVPPYASREHIAYELAALLGLELEPWVMSRLITELAR